MDGPSGNHLSVDEGNNGTIENGPKRISTLKIFEFASGEKNCA